jgi:glutathione S-transferase
VIETDDGTLFESTPLCLHVAARLGAESLAPNVRAYVDRLKARPARQRAAARIA